MEALAGYDYGEMLVATIVGAVALAAITYIWKSISKLRFLERPHVPTLVFVSTGGTCRDPMAKAIMQNLLEGREPPVEVLAAGISKGHSDRAAKAARFVVEEGLGKDMLGDHRTQALNATLIAKADLILTMDPIYTREVCKLFPTAAPKTFDLYGFVGGSGKIKNPYRAPDEMDSKAITRYRECFEELRVILTSHCETILRAVTGKPI